MHPLLPLVILACVSCAAQQVIAWDRTRRGNTISRFETVFLLGVEGILQIITIAVITIAASGIGAQ